MAINGEIGVGMPQWILLHQFGKLIYDAFGEFPYLVGSAAVNKEWRDVDVRLILDDTLFEILVGKLEQPLILNRRWSAFCLAWSALGKQMIGLPIDFQIQQRTYANTEFAGRPRRALILFGGVEADDNQKRANEII